MTTTPGASEPSSGDEVKLTGGERTAVTRRGDVVLRPAAPWSAATTALLEHLRDVGFPGAPHPVGSGLSADGREAVTFVPGSIVHPHTWSDEAVTAVGALLRRLHDAVATFTPPPRAQWQPWFGRTLGEGPRAISHCDTGPWNIIARNGLPVALIDWEFAGPVDLLVELAQAAWLNAHLMGDRVAQIQGSGTLADRACQLRLLVDGYGLPHARREHLLELMVEVAVSDAKNQADEAGVTPAGTEVAPLWAMTWRIDSAEWMLRHRRTLVNALR
ncbi:phosphotransferase [Kineococcus sp. R8]|uniref:phosphotransferase n=1 Tax=Kineococcus siccus TaxID=2696567 RepID=UPI00141239BC|nr:phosphotransferase [Kineococcus siccus]NAZ83918.1 phosphotransferase [Kineococcus siccus]